MPNQKVTVIISYYQFDPLVDIKEHLSLSDAMGFAYFEFTWEFGFVGFLLGVKRIIRKEMIFFHFFTLSELIS